jgi:hypothetical protein
LRSQRGEILEPGKMPNAGMQSAMSPARMRSGDPIRD